MNTAQESPLLQYLVLPLNTVDNKTHVNGRRISSMVSLTTYVFQKNNVSVANAPLVLCLNQGVSLVSYI